MASFTRDRAAPACLALSLTLASSAPWASADPTGTPTAPSKLDTVSITAKRNAGATASTVMAARSKLLSHKYASSCAFMSDSAAKFQNDVALAYARDFYPDGDPLLGVDVESGKLVIHKDQRFNDLSPEGDASTDEVISSLESNGESLVNSTQVKEALDPSHGCTSKDRRFAADVNWIARKDKSLTQALEAFDAGNYTEARTLFEENWRKLGYEESAIMLGRIHLLGLGTPANTPHAIEWLRKVVDARYDPIADRLRFDPKKPGNLNTRVEATLLLAGIHLAGQGIARNPAETYKWWAKALDYGFEPAGTLLGQAHLRGIGTPPDAKRALGYLQAAAEAGDANALYMLGQLHHHQLPGQPDGVPLDLKRAGAYYGAAAKAGHLEATYAAARMMDLGEGMAPSPENAVVLYKEAALKGHAGAQNALATYFYGGEVVGQDLAAARQLFHAAARGRQPDAMFNLAVMLAQGQGGDKDMAAAYAWCALAKGLGHGQAASALPAIEAKLSPEDKARAEAMLKPAPKKS